MKHVFIFLFALSCYTITFAQTKTIADKINESGINDTSDLTNRIDLNTRITFTYDTIPVIIVVSDTTLQGSILTSMKAYIVFRQSVIFQDSYNYENHFLDFHKQPLDKRYNVWYCLGCDFTY